MRKVAVVGAGTMGNGIAHVFALHGYPVTLVDTAEEALNKALTTISKNLDRMVQKNKISSEQKVATLVRIQTTKDIEQGVGGSSLVIEAIPEFENLKVQLFQNLDQWAPTDAILASNTSSISITKLAAATTNPKRVIGMHFMNPVPIMQLVEVIRGYDTDDSTCAQVISISEDIGKTAVEVNDYPGFVSNRVLMPMINEAIYTVQEGVASVTAVDEIMRLGMAHPMGPLQLADFIGLDVCLAILKVMHQGFGQSKYSPCPLLIKMVEAGHQGRKAGIGFYRYDKGQMIDPAPQFS